MEIMNYTQGSKEWLEYRMLHDNASDIAAAMGLSKYKTRNEYIAEKATGISKEHDAYTLKIFAEGHAFEALARPLAEEIIDQDLYQLVGRLSNGGLSASYDGLTYNYSINFEHKSLNEELREIMSKAGCTGADLPKMYRVQMQQQMMVAGEKCEKTLFMASRWDLKTNELIEEYHCWYVSDKELEKEIIAAWEQVHEDVKAYVPQEIVVKAVARPALELMNVDISVSGEVAIINNFADFEIDLRDFIDNRLIKNPVNDQDFADLEAQIKTLKKAEDALNSAEAAALAKFSAIEKMQRMKDMLHKLTRDTRLLSEKLVEAEKTNRKNAIVAFGKDAINKHISAINETIKPLVLPLVAFDFAGAIKGKRTLLSMEDAVGVELARAKIEANAIADLIRKNQITLRENAKDFPFLFADAQQLVMKSNEDLIAVIKVRISEHEAAIEKKAQETIAIQKREAEEAETRKHVVEIEKVEETKVDVVKVESVFEEKVAEKIESKTIEKPDDQYIIKVISDTFGVDVATARIWIKSVK